MPEVRARLSEGNASHGCLLREDVVRHLLHLRRVSSCHLEGEGDKSNVQLLEGLLLLLELALLASEGSGEWGLGGLLEHRLGKVACDGDIKGRRAVGDLGQPPGMQTRSAR